jgi:hypothetical protein
MLQKTSEKFLPGRRPHVTQAEIDGVTMSEMIDAGLIMIVASGVGELKPKGLHFAAQADASHQEASMPEINTRFLFTLALEIQVSSAAK